MSFQPRVGDQLRIDETTYRIAEHPSAPGPPYGQEGRRWSLASGQVYRNHIDSPSDKYDWFYFDVPAAHTIEA
jgi:hypothetical protein